MPEFTLVYFLEFLYPFTLAVAPLLLKNTEVDMPMTQRSGQAEPIVQIFKTLLIKV